MPIHHSFFESPVGTIEIKTGEEYIHSVCFVNTVKKTLPTPELTSQQANNHPMPELCIKQLREYFGGARKIFELPLQQDGTIFQQKVWAELMNIPYGRTISYLELSKRIGNVKAIRAVGTTNGLNSIAVIVPCHRVIGSNGDLTGYAGDLWRKKWLLDHEGKYANGVQTLF